MNIAKALNQARAVTSVEGRYWQDVTCGGVTNIPRYPARHIVAITSCTVSPPTAF